MDRYPEHRSPAGRLTPDLLHMSLVLGWQENLMIFEFVASFKLGRLDWCTHKDLKTPSPAVVHWAQEQVAVSKTPAPSIQRQ